MTHFNFISRDLIFGKLEAKTPEEQEVERNCYGEPVGNLEREEKRTILGDLDDNTAERTAGIRERYCS